MEMHCNMYTYIRVFFYFKLSANEIEMRSNYTDALNLALRIQNLVTNISILAGYAVEKD